jgi:predicted metalloprotease with PDZ domain
MEHAYGTAISISAASGPVEASRLSDVSAHEFFHLWNVKRIRPQSLEPVDYQHQQDTRALWFSEGLTSTVGQLMLSREALIDEPHYLKGIAREIGRLEGRTAYLWQSAEESSLDAWFEDDEFYRTPERSISYYNKGYLLGVLLDLRIRELTNDSKSLRDLFQWMNQHYAKQHRYFPDSQGVQDAAETITGQSFAEFFRDYVAGVKPLPYDEFLRFVGLQLASENVTLAEVGFTSEPGLDGLPVITAVSPGSDAARAGLSAGDRILQVNGRPATFRFDRELDRMMPNQTAKLRIARAGKQHTLEIKIGARREQELVLTDVAGITAEQRAHRVAWIHGDDEPGGTQ